MRTYNNNLSIFVLLIFIFVIMGYFEDFTLKIKYVNDFSGGLHKIGYKIDWGLINQNYQLLV